MRFTPRGLAPIFVVFSCCMPGVASAGPEIDPVLFKELHEIEIKFHAAASAKDIEQMMSLFAEDASLSVGGKLYQGKRDVRGYFEKVAGPFRPQNHWVAYTPAQRIRIEASGDRAYLYFECLYVDVLDKDIKAHTFSDDVLVRSGARWLIREMKAGVVSEL
jgi:ketosteroid isomerase-like protein